MKFPNLLPSFQRALRGAHTRTARRAPPHGELVDALLAAKDAQIASAERELRERLAAKDALLAAAEVRLVEHAVTHADALARSKHDTDVARGVVNARGLLEACLAELWQRSASSRGGGSAVHASQKLSQLLAEGAGARCPELVEYLRVAARENRVPADVLLRQARKLFDVLSERLHTESAVGGGTSRLPSALFQTSGRASMIALAALVRFADRHLELYGFSGDIEPITLRPRSSAVPASPTP